MENPLNEPAVTPENTATVVVPRYHLPDDWSGKGACPVCRTPGRLRVQHQDVTPDRMVCGVCGTAFEVENAGTRIRLAATPPGLAASPAGLLNAWLTSAELLVVLERGAPTVPNSPFEEPLGTRAPQPALSAAPTPAVSNVSKTPTAPLTPKPTNGAVIEPESEPGTEDWFASLAAAIGGASPVTPLSDAVLADELERALLNRSEVGPSDTAGPAPAVIGGDMILDGPVAATAPGSTPAPTAAAPEMLKAAGPKRADVVLAETIAAPSASRTSAAVVVAAPAPGNLSPGLASTPVAAPSTLGPAVTLPPAEPPATLAPSAPLVVSPLAAGPTAVGPAAVGVVLVPAMAGAPARRELAERAWKLHELGNSLPSIQSALETSGGLPEDISVIMAKLVALEQARQARFRRTLQLAAGAALLGLMLLIVVALAVSNLSAPAPNPVADITAGSVSPSPGSTALSGTPAPGQPAPTAAPGYNPIIALINKLLPGDVKIANGPSPTPASSVLGGLFPATATLSANDLATGDAKKSKLPPWLATLVPSSITVINVATPSLDPNGPPKSACPATAAEASVLFGGPADSWSFSRQLQGWIFILADNPTSIRIPANMTAGYLVLGDSLTMLSAVGPVTIHNVNFVAVSCE